MYKIFIKEYINRKNSNNYIYLLIKILYSLK